MQPKAFIDVPFLAFIDSRWHFQARVTI
jgi:hypothetical protein